MKVLQEAPLFAILRNATHYNTHARAEAIGEPAEFVAVVELVEGVEQDDDAALAGIVAEPLVKTPTEAVEIKLGFFLGLAFGCGALR